MFRIQHPRIYNDAAIHIQWLTRTLGRLLQNPAWGRVHSGQNTWGTPRPSKSAQPIIILTTITTTIIIWQATVKWSPVKRELLGRSSLLQYHTLCLIRPRHCRQVAILDTMVIIRTLETIPSSLDSITNSQQAERQVAKN
ncbi:hypothetical protein COCON_G00062490 [Conger conger]|uniref:Uncharacterized protein n=1 Tax=Conger conger TaxID=82655 RepID=A0A9Q1I3Q5_CONCO|nr:hypothetical protein COCON_G00062490 [Conger conger]